jgi:predicted HicB family RNase H-like nuclease
MTAPRKADPTGAEAGTLHIGVRVTPSQRAVLASMAAAQGVSVSEVVRQLIRAAVTA